MKFTKMHGLGNDYVYVDCFREKVENPPEFAKRISDRHWGIGADGLILIGPSNCACFRMEIFNADGSGAQMCGNGLRCAARLAYESGICRGEKMTVETGAGLREAEILLEKGKVTGVRADMGVPRYNAHSIPILSEKDLVLNDPVWVSGKEYHMTGVSMGNPHAVVYVDEVWNFPVGEVGPGFEFHPRFPERINVEFCHVRNRHHIEMRVWERGAGETLACGTGACAAVVASVLNHLTEEEVTVTLLGGNLNVRWDRPVNHVFLTGPAERVFDGEIEPG